MGDSETDQTHETFTKMNGRGSHVHMNTSGQPTGFTEQQISNLINQLPPAVLHNFMLAASKAV